MSTGEGSLPPLEQTRPPGRLATLVRGVLWTVGVGCFLAALPLTLWRWGDPHSKWGVLAVALTPAGLLLALIALVCGVILAVTAVRDWAVVTAGVGATLSAIAIGVHVAWLAPLYVGATPASTGTPLVVLTQNLEYGDAGDLARVVTEEKVDVLVLSDLVPGQREAVLASPIRATLPHLVGADRGSMVLSRYPLTGEQLVSDGGDSRTVQVSTPQLGAVTLIAVHPTPAYLGDQWSGDHDRIRSLAATKAGGATIVAGDFNATLDHQPMRQLHELGYSDSVEQTNGGFRPTWPAGGRHRVLGVSIPAALQIDHVLVSDRIVAQTSRDVSVAGTDHHGVLAHVARRT